MKTPTLVIVQGLRAHLFEVHDAVHKDNSTAIKMHSGMASEEISEFIQNTTTRQSPDDNQTSVVISTLEEVQMQLNGTISAANSKNMTEVMTNIKQADDQLASLLPQLGYTGDTNATNAKTTAGD